MKDQRRRILIITYTMTDPMVVGVFFRALRLAQEFHRRGWQPVICNRGPQISDPKVEASRSYVEHVALPEAGAGYGPTEITRSLMALRPDAIIFGEGPFDTMEPFFAGARATKLPFVLLDQYYGDALLQRRYDVDQILLYGIPSLWRGDFNMSARYRLIPPFIGDLKLPEELTHDPGPSPLLLLVGFDRVVREQGLQVVAKLRPGSYRLVLISPDPEAGRNEALSAGCTAKSLLSLPLQKDAYLFGLLAQAQAAIWGNGFMQMMEALALATPALCIERGVGFEAWALDERFEPYISVGESKSRQVERLQSWLAQSPFSPALQRELLEARDGARQCADHVHELLEEARWIRWRRRAHCRAVRIKRRLRGQAEVEQPLAELSGLDEANA